MTEVKIMDVSQLFTLLESNQSSVAEEIRALIRDSFNSTKESWLLNGLFDYFLSTSSARCVEILLAIREPHDKYLFDRLYDCLKGSCKLQGLTLLGYVVRKHPSWLYKISSHPLLKELLKLLKTENDVVLMMSALLVITTLLPMIPALVAPFLQDIFEIFSRLASWNFHRPQQTPQIFQLHLQMGLYALFHRLYGMYPCNFLSYLRQLYGHAGKEDLQVFSHTVKPMIYTVKMHPLLVTATKEAELATARWKRMETHDIVVECAKFSTDAQKMGNGSHRIYYHPSSRSRSNLELSSGNEFFPPIGSGSSQYSSQIVHFTETSGDLELWTPAYACGLSTPPPQQLEVDGARPVSTSVPQTPTPQGLGTPLTREHLSPPEAAVEATPETTPFTTPIKEVDTTRNKVAPSVATTTVRPVAFGSKSTSIRTLSSGTSTPSQSHPSSPMKKEPSPFRFPDSCFERRDSLFSSEKRDSLFTQRLQKVALDRMQVTEPSSPKPFLSNAENFTEMHKKVSRQLSPIKTPDCSYEITSPVKFSESAQPHVNVVAKPVPKPIETGEKDLSGQVFNFVSSNDACRNGPDTLHSLEDQEVSDIVSQLESQVETASGQATPSLQENEDHCDGVLRENHHSYTPHAQDEYDECDGSTELRCKSGGLHMPNSTSILDFAKRVHRLRFYSHCGPAPNLHDIFNSVGTSPSDKSMYLKVRRANSCPDIKKHVSTDSIDSPEVKKVDSSVEVKDTLHKEVKINGKAAKCNSVNETETDVESSLQKQCSSTSSLTDKTNSRHSSGTQTIDCWAPYPYEHLLPYEHLFSGVLPQLIASSESAAYDTKFHCTADFPLDSLPGNSQMPVELLDQLIQSATANHMREVSETERRGSARMKLAGPEWEDVKILQGEILLLHNQLLFERYRREIHAERNRRLLGKAKSARALEEHNIALQDQLRLLEQEMKSLHQQVECLQTSNRQLSEETASCSAEMCRFEQENKKLQEMNRSQEENAQKKTLAVASLQKELQKVQASLFNSQSDVTILRHQVAMKNQLQTELTEKNKELMLMGELQLRYREKISQIPVTYHRQAENELLRESCRDQVEGIQVRLESHVAQLEAAQAHIAELESLLMRKDTTIAEQKRLMKTVEGEYQGQLQAVERKYKANKAMNQQLEEQILELYHKLDLATKSVPRSRKGQSPSSNSLDSELDRTTGSSPDKSGPYATIGSSPEKMTAVGSPHSSLSESLGSEKGESMKKLYRDVPMQNLEVIADREVKIPGAEEEKR